MQQSWEPPPSRLAREGETVGTGGGTPHCYVIYIGYTISTAGLHSNRGATRGFPHNTTNVTKTPTVTIPRELIGIVEIAHSVNFLTQTSVITAATRFLNLENKQ